MLSRIGRQFASHGTVNHGAREYARGCNHVNTAEGYHSNLKRAIDGTFHHVSTKHLGRYLDEFNFKYNSRKQKDGARVIDAIRCFEGKRLTLFRAVSAPNADSLRDFAK